MTSRLSRQLIPRPLRNRSRRWAISRDTLAVLDSLPAQVALIDAAGVILAVNAAWHRFAEANGYAGSGHGVGLNYLEICRQAADFADARVAEQAIRAIIAQEQTEYSYEYPSRSSGIERWFLFRAVGLTGIGPVRVMVSHEEITQLTDRRHEEDQLRDQAKRLDILHEIDQTILTAGSLEAIAQVVLRIIYRLIPYRRASVIVYDFEPGEFQLAAIFQNGAPLEPPARRSLIAESVVIETILPALQRGETYAYDLHDLIAHWPEASELLAAGMRYQICIPLIAQGELFGSMQIATPTQEFFDSVYLPIIREILDSLAIGVRQARLFEQVRAARERQRELSRQLVEAQELERRQLARELHDRVGQNLAVLNMNLMSARSQLTHESARRVNGRLADAIQIVAQTVEQVRNVMADLRPAILDDFGLVAALRWYMRHFARHTDLAVLLDVEEPPAAPRLPPDLETALFRIAQEALTNVLRHARASLATLTLTTVDPTIRLVISDDGVGFNLATLPRRTRRWSLGLMTMQERVEAVGGRLVIDSAPGQGTRVIVEVAR